MVFPYNSLIPTGNEFNILNPINEQ